MLEMAAESRPLPQTLKRVLCDVQERILKEQSADRVAEKLARCLQCLSPRITDEDEPSVLGIDLNVIRTLCFEGVPDEAFALRAVFWKVVLGYLPPDIFEWDNVLREKRSLYEGFVRDVVLDPPDRENDLVFDQINKDVFRTRPEMDFFAQGVYTDTAPSMDSEEAQVDPEDEEFINVTAPCRHYDILGRILLIYAKLNPGIQYVQGMNELCAPLYFLFCHDPCQEASAEADAFFCFTAMMSDLRDAFCKLMDHTENGMHGRIRKLNDLLRVKDMAVWQRLEDNKVQPLYYSLRWVTLLLTQELDMPDLLRVWDSFLSDFAQPHPFLHYFCVAMIIQIREALLAGDFQDNMRLLQRYPPIPVDGTLKLASQLRSLDLAEPGVSNEDVANANAGGQGVRGRLMGKARGVWSHATTWFQGAQKGNSPPNSEYPEPPESPDFTEFRPAPP